MGTYRRKQTTVEAVQISWKTWGEVCEFVAGDGALSEAASTISADHASDTLGEEGPYIFLRLPTAHGDMASFRHGDWILRDAKPGTFYPVKPGVFAATYVAVDEGGESLAQRAATEVLNDLMDRSGIGDELDGVDAEVMGEIRDSLAERIAKIYS